MNRKWFTHGIGRLDAQTINDMNAASWTVNQASLPFPTPAWQGPYMAVINPPSGDDPQELEFKDDGVTPIKWGYDWVIVSPNGTDDLMTANSSSYQSLGAAAAGATALNLCELNNTDQQAMGVQFSNVPEGIELQPVPGLTHVMLWIAVSEFDSADTTTPGKQGYVAYFTYPNQFDGECP